ncbi:MAG: bifunctional glutamate N-acetyltransferase/amino-acid acetyltransferase ArgJ [Lentisphaerae bacterium]|nr:bifunctional glutamate N-acetyltransferase/amino-acid acetyltransferase ArgJ [Lentisphaerota bacterium]
MNTFLPAGYRYAGVRAGINPSSDKSKKDLALIISGVPAVAAGVFTKNRVKAAPVLLCKRRINNKISAIVVNSGNANACTGQQGFDDAVRMGRTLAELLDVPETRTLVCSTGTIGVPMPVKVIDAGIRDAVTKLAPDSADDVASAIMTTDTKPKQVTRTFNIGGRQITVHGLAKGSGMISPNMATMLAFILTDAAVDRPALKSCLKDAVDLSFNRVTVDGDMSTNDTVIALANGLADNKPLRPGAPGWKAFQTAIREVTLELALMIAADGEGATKLVTVIVRGAASPKDAQLAAKSVANSLLVKTAWYGSDPNWGRVMAALGYSGAKIQPDRVSISYNDLCVVRNGISANAPIKRFSEIIEHPKFTIEISLGLGKNETTVYSCDISHEYVNLNASYMT